MQWDAAQKAAFVRMQFDAQHGYYQEHVRPRDRRARHRRHPLMAAPLLDTHAWIWWIEGDRHLPRRVRETLDRLPLDERPYLSANTIGFLLISWSPVESTGHQPAIRLLKAP